MFPPVAVEGRQDCESADGDYGAESESGCQGDGGSETYTDHHSSTEQTDGDREGGRYGFRIISNTILCSSYIAFILERPQSGLHIITSATPLRTNSFLTPLQSMHPQAPRVINVNRFLCVLSGSHFITE